MDGITASCGGPQSVSPSHHRIAEWLPSSGYEIESDYEIEVYGPGDTHSDGYLCELWIPVHKK